MANFKRKKRKAGLKKAYNGFCWCCFRIATSGNAMGDKKLSDKKLLLKYKEELNASVPERNMGSLE